MGYGLGAAIGATYGRPDKTVVNIAGDGCFRMNMNELATAVRSGHHLVEIVLNNHVLGMVRQWQTLFYDERYSQTIVKDQVDLKRALASEGVVVVECVIDEDQKVFPMVPAGANLEDVFDEEDIQK